MNENINDLVIVAPRGFKKVIIGNIITFEPITSISTWEDINDIDGFYIDKKDGSINVIGKNVSVLASDSKLIYRTRGQASKSKAIAQLSQIMYFFNKGWVPDWSVDTKKYCVKYYNNEVLESDYTYSYHFIAFKNEEDRDKFLKCPEFVKLATDYFNN